MFAKGVAPYELAPRDKESFLKTHLKKLLVHHEKACGPYARVVQDWRRFHPEENVQVTDYPFLPVSVFKEFELKSISANVMAVQSSGTTTGKPSRIFVDPSTRKRQTISAHKIWTDFIGAEPRPYLVFDLESTVRGTAAMSARGAAILSLAHHASEFHFVMREEVDGRLILDMDRLTAALSEIGDKPFFGYGFTYILYQVHQELMSAGFRAPNVHLESRFLHSGGWKKLADIAVDKRTYNTTVASVWGLPPKRVTDFYGAVEQIGVPYPDCPEGAKHVPYWAEVIIRRNDTLETARPGETGLMQLISTLPLSAPNHSVLTEDLGQIVTRDECKCGRRGTAFVFKGRAPRSEVRGCSDVGRG